MAADQVVDDAVVGVEQQLPAERGDNRGDHHRHDQRGAEQADPGQVDVEQQRDAEPGSQFGGDGDGGVAQRQRQAADEIRDRSAGPGSCRGRRTGRRTASGRASSPRAEIQREAAAAGRTPAAWSMRWARRPARRKRGQASAQMGRRPGHHGLLVARRARPREALSERQQRHQLHQTAPSSTTARRFPSAFSGRYTRRPYRQHRPGLPQVKDNAVRSSV